MEQLWVAVVLVVSTTLFSSGVDGSVLHGIAGGPGYLELVPHDLLYTNVHSPLLLSQLHGVRIDESLSGRLNGQEQPPPALEQSQAVNGKEAASPAPVAEVPAEIAKNEIIAQEQLYNHIFGINSQSAESQNVIENGVISADDKIPTSSPESQATDVQTEIPSPALQPTEVKPETPLPALPPTEVKPETSLPALPPTEVQPETPLPALPPTEVQPESPLPALPPTEVQPEASSPDLQPAVVKTYIPSPVQQEIQSPVSLPDILVPPPTPQASSVESSDSSIPIILEQEALLPPVALPKNNVGGVYINAEKGKLQMQATLLSDGEGLTLLDAAPPQLNSDSVSVVVSELPPSVITKGGSKAHIITNVNVNVNVNGDGTGSVINSTSLAKNI